MEVIDSKVLLHKEKKLLKTINKFLNATNADFITLSQLHVKRNDYYLKNLIEKGLVSEVNASYNPETGTSPFKGVAPSEKGKHYFEMDRELEKQLLVKSILIPVITSLLTTFTIWLIGWLLGLIRI